MVFSSLTFLFVFFPLVFVLYFVCKNDWARNILLIIASLIFYAYGEPVAVFIMLISILFNYLFGLICAGEKFRMFGLAAAVILNIGLLFVFKYADFFLECVGLTNIRLGLALPIGISFFTFQGMSYVIDVYRDRKCVQKNLLSVMLYISFFPQLIAGPIVKYTDIRKQLTKREFNLDRISRGIQRFAFGLGKKMLIAGPMGLMVDTVFAQNINDIGAISAWIAAVSYLFQIYFDFSGYSDMAIGLGCIFGFDFKENFDKPYTTNSIKLFWRKWHISLSSWFRDYVYIPMGGNRKGRVRTYLNQFTVFILTGLWHGANLTFVVWGVAHGVALIVEDLIKGIGSKEKTDRSPVLGAAVNAFGHIYSLLFVTLAFVIFRADNLSLGFHMIGRMFGGCGTDSVAFSLATPTYMIALILAVFFASSLPDVITRKTNEWVMRIFSVFVYIASIIMLISGGYNPFIYFRF